MGTVSAQEGPASSTLDRGLRQFNTPQSPGASPFFFALREELRASDPLAHAWREENGRQVRLV